METQTANIENCVQINQLGWQPQGFWAWSNGIYFDNEFHQVDEYNGLITDYIDYVENDNVSATLIRGIRNGIDLDYESNQLSFINDIRPNTKVLYIPCDKKYEHISSSAIRNLMIFNSELTKKYLP